MADNFILAVGIYMLITLGWTASRGTAGHSTTTTPVDYMFTALLAAIFAFFAFFVRFN
jgi:hypothetical protein